MIARIYRPTRGATQSGHARTKAWLLEYERLEPAEIEPLMGWTSSSRDRTRRSGCRSTRKEEAIAFAEKRGIAYRVEEPAARPSAADSPTPTISSRPAGQWTH